MISYIPIINDTDFFRFKWLISTIRVEICARNTFSCSHGWIHVFNMYTDSQLYDAECKHLILFMHEQKLLDLCLFTPVWNIVYWYYFPTLSYFLSLNQGSCFVVYIPSFLAISSFPPLHCMFVFLFPECSAYMSSCDSPFTNL